MKSYPIYKDSGVVWVGAIPAHWLVQKLKYSSYIKGRIGWQNLRSSEFTDEGPYLITGMHFKDGSVDWHSCYHITEERYAMAPEIQVKEHDVLITKDGSIGKLAYIDYLPNKASLNSHLLLIRPLKQQFIPRYLYYLLSSSVFQIYVLNEQVGTTFYGITQESIVNFPAIFPHLPEQRSIAQYLDRQTAKIDTLITAKQDLLELLTEKRRALITQAVTRGLNPDAPLCDSGIGWLGMFPKHWETGRLKLICKSLQTGPFGSQLHAEDYVDGGIPVINPAHLINGRIEPDEQVTVNEIMAEHLGIHKLEVGDVVLARRGDIGRCGLVTRKEVGWLCGTGSLRVRPDREILDSKYLILLLTSTFAGSWLSLMSVGTTMDNLNTEIVGELAIPLPSLREQQAIVSYVENQTSKLDDLKAVTKHTINLLQERRTALISVAVTGQVRIEESHATQQSYP